MAVQLGLNMDPTIAESSAIIPTRTSNKIATVLAFSFRETAEYPMYSNAIYRMANTSTA
jgi:hypothetical protein